MKLTYHSNIKVTILAPFSLTENWAGHSWPFLKELQRVFGDNNVEFFGKGRSGVSYRSSSIKRLKYKWWPLLAGTCYGIYTLSNRDIIVIWWGKDLMYSLGILRALLPIRTKAKVVWVGFNAIKRSGFASYLKQQLISLALKRTDLIICNSIGQLKSLNSIFPSIVGRLVYLHYSGPNRISEDVYALAKKRDQGYIFSGGYGNRDYSTLVSAIREIGCAAKIVITPSYRQDLDLQSSDPIEVYENIPGEQFGRLMAQSAFVVIPLRNVELAGGILVLMQAMELGKAVIITDVEGMSDYVQHGREALLVKACDVEDLKGKIEVLRTDKKLRAQIAQNARRLFQRKFTWENCAHDIARQIISVFEHKK